jgi:hypothetical protein
MKQIVSKYSPNFLKVAYRLFRYRNERHKFIREIGIRKKQDLLLQDRYNAEGGKLILFLIPGSDWATGKDRISGGTMSVISVCEETSALLDEPDTQTIMCTMRGDHLFLKHMMFKNSTPVFRFGQLAFYFNRVTEILIHIPEFMTGYFQASLSTADKRWMERMDHVHINIMNQNIQLMPSPQQIAALQGLAGTVTLTTAHEKYCSLYYRNYYGVPVHRLSVWISPEQYIYRDWEEKENLLVVSPDRHPIKEDILGLLEKVAGLKVQVISNLTYEQYKELIARAKWSLTFGEGLDGYLIEPIFSGAIAFAVYNESFFTPDFRELPTIYPSCEILKKQLVSDMALMDNKRDFTDNQRRQFQLCAKYYSKERYRDNIAAFYRGDYTFS